MSFFPLLFFETARKYKIPIREETVNIYKKLSNPDHALKPAISFASPNPMPSFFLIFLNRYMINKKNNKEIIADKNEFNTLIEKGLSLG